MVAPHEVILKLNYAFYLVRIVLFEEQKELGFNCSLIVVLFLVFDHLDGNQLLSLMILALQDLTEGTLAN